MTAAPLLIGWDVGGWDCDRNANSRDALVVLDADRDILGRPWRGNLRRTINASRTTDDWIAGLLERCSVDPSVARTGAVLAIDAPLRVAQSFLKLVNGQPPVDEVLASDSNPYLYRETERFLIARGHRPLSAVKDMIGSQSTKAMHAVGRFTPECTGTGVWAGSGGVRSIEAYPAVARKSDRVQRLLDEHVDTLRADGERSLPGFEHADCVDALLCALVGWLFVDESDALAWPDDDVPGNEGWIWVPRDALDDPPDALRVQ